jgi:PPOX class probable FMN-dependent enzyme
MSDIDLTAIYRAPLPPVAAKKQGRLDAASVEFIRRCTFAVLSTHDDEGNCDASPRGGPAGFLAPTDDQCVVIADMNGNNLIDSIRNIATTGKIGMLMIHPGRSETLRINGSARLSTDAAHLDLFATVMARPKLAIVVDIAEVYVHCAKAVKRGRLFDPQLWAELSGAPDAADILACQFGMPSPDQIRTALASGYEQDLLADQPTSD